MNCVVSFSTMSASFSYMFVFVIFVTIILFVGGEIWSNKRRILCGFGAIFEGVTFFMLSFLFYKIEWNGIPFEQYMSIFPLAGAILSLRMAYRRFTGKDP